MFCRLELLMHTTSASPAYLTAGDVQRLIRVDRSTIYRMAESGRLPAVKVGRQWRFPAAAIEQWLAGDTDRPTGDFPDSCMQNVADLFADIYGVMVIVTDINGHPVTEVSNPCGYFDAVSSEAEALERCIAEWKSLGTEYDFAPRLRPSHLGFLCTRAFIRVDNELAGMVIAGGIAPETWPPSPAEIEAIAEESRVPVEVMTRAVADVHHLPPEDQERFLEGVCTLARHLSRIESDDRRSQRPAGSTP
jgi:excisionase family DNA binding protein